MLGEVSRRHCRCLCRNVKHLHVAVLGIHQRSPLIPSIDLRTFVSPFNLGRIPASIKGDALDLPCAVSLPATGRRLTHIGCGCISPVEQYLPWDINLLACVEYFHHFSPKNLPTVNALACAQTVLAIVAAEGPDPPPPPTDTPVVSTVAPAELSVTLQFPEI